MRSVDQRNTDHTYQARTHITSRNRNLDTELLTMLVRTHIARSARMALSWMGTMDQHVLSSLPAPPSEHQVWLLKHVERFGEPA